MRIDIIIVNWNSGSFLQECVESIIRHGKQLVSKIIIVDNNSQDKSAFFAETCSKIKLVKLKENLGFGKACNIGANYCNNEFILFLNPDAKLYSNTLEHVLSFISKKENYRVGICGVQLENGYGEVTKSNSRFPSTIRLLSHSIGLSKIFPKLGAPMSESDHSITKKVDQVMGAFFFVRRSLFVGLNGFDERFFVYYEEVDFSYRAKLLGWSSVFISDAKAYHFGGGISQNVKAERLFYSQRSKIQYIFKHFNFFSALLVLSSTLLIEPILRLIISLINNFPVATKENVRAYYMLFKWLLFYNLRKKK